MSNHRPSAVRLPDGPADAVARASAPLDAQPELCDGVASSGSVSDGDGEGECTLWFSTPCSKRKRAVADLSVGGDA